MKKDFIFNACKRSIKLTQIFGIELSGQSILAANAVLNHKFVCKNALPPRLILGLFIDFWIEEKSRTDC